MDDTETKVHGIHVGSGGLYMGLSGGAAMAMAEMLVEQYKQGGGINYIEMRFESKEVMPGERFLVTVQRVVGKTPHELRVDAEAERGALRAELERNRGDLIIEADRANRAEAERDALQRDADRYRAMRAQLPAALMGDVAPVLHGARRGG